MKKSPAEITGKQKRFLKGEAHHLDPLVRVGQEGITPGLVSAVSEVLERHELVKIKLLENAPTDKNAAGPELAEACGAHHVGTVGRIVILYRRHPEKPKLPLPSH